MSNHTASIQKVFTQRFGVDPDLIVSAPGRVNLIGEHTDYMGGLVMPVAIDRESLFAIRLNGLSVIRGYSMNFNESVEVVLGDFDKQHPAAWFRYVLGVLKEFKSLDYPLAGFDFCVTGNVPIGSGLSSSASVSVATATAIISTFGITMSKKEVALLCQRSENSFVGVQCGIMDQMISACGVKGHALRIDCNDYSTELIPAQVPGCTWLVIDSKKKRGLVDSEYNFRIVQCLNGLKFLQKMFPAKKIENLRDVSLAELKSVKASADPVVYKRIHHVISENLRVFQASEALKKGDIETLGSCLYASHKSLRDDFEVSCPELNALVEIVSSVTGSVGARLTGAGFGGCSIALVRDFAVEATISAIKSQYSIRFPEMKDKVEVWPIKVSDGSGVVFSQKGLVEKTV